MGLYRIMLVDDEEEVRKAIMRKMDWEQLGFVLVGDAENGEDALEQLEQLEPDVVMTDIRMPYMDGLTLTEKIRGKYPSIKILIFSGYDDFEYAQRAIKLNAAEYILKPVNGEELAAILSRIRKNLDEEIEQRRNIDILQERYLSSLPILRELFLNDLVRMTANVETIVPRLCEYGIDILDARKWLTAMIHVDQAERMENQVLSEHRELILISVRDFVEDYLRPYCRFATFNSADGITIIVAVDEDNTQTGLMNLLSDVCKESRRLLDVPITIGVGRSCDTLQEIGRSYQTCVDALGYRAIVGGGKVIYINDMEPVSRGKLQLDDKGEAELTAAIKFGPKEQIERVIRDLAIRMEDAKVHASQYQVYMLSIVNSMIRLMQQYDLNISEMFDAGNQYADMMERIYVREEFAERIIPIAYRMNEALNRERDNTTKKVIRQAKEYIRENYANPDLSVEMLCRHLHMSPAYFSTVFKKETGQTYVNYLTEVRLKKAVELLNETDDKTYMIAQKVGYQEQNYFSYVFKKQYGVSPTKYRGT
ncbi:response regulator [Parablautia muri]|uniref:Stage 0 sporulation protein A homolog n=1 Tax=Parablautia muri TaxID=2320879 RepID=A0A9X5BGP0_9FIRM|nr:response regulator [Parablautia muri]NBJ93724.1 response regulator [Parablautia muri]